MFRHGARSPLVLDEQKKDIFGNQWIDQGELTSVGMRQHFLLGYRNSEVYGKALSIKKFSPQEIYITSTNFNRTIMSVYSQLQGFFPPSTGPQLNTEQLITALPPIEYDFTQELGFLKNDALREQANVFPIKVMDRADHEFYLHDDDVCLPVKKIVENAKNKELVKNFTAFFNKNYAPQMYKILNETKATFDLEDYNNLAQIFDTYICSYTDGRKFPQFDAQNVSTVDFFHLTTDFLYLEMFEVYIDNDYVALMSMSPLFSEIINYMERRIDKDVNNITIYSDKDPKISMISGHDTNLAAFMRFIKVVFNRTELIYPSFASSVYVELVYDDNVVSDVPIKKYFVNVFVNEENLFNESLRYEYFRDEIEKKLISTQEIADFCKFSELKSSTNNWLLIAVISLGVLAFGLFIWLMVIIFKSKNNITLNDSDFDPVLS